VTRQISFLPHQELYEEITTDAVPSAIFVERRGDV
jgi:hypothetical protein